MKKIVLLLLTLMFSLSQAYAMISPKAMLDSINSSKIKTPATITKIKTVNNVKGNRVLLIEFKTLNAENTKYQGVCLTYKKIMFWDRQFDGMKIYYPKKGDKVFVTISEDGGDITSMVKLYEDFEKVLSKSPDAVKFDCMGAYIEEK